MFVHIGNALLQSFQIGFLDFVLGYTAMHLQGTCRNDKHRQFRSNSGFAAFNKSKDVNLQDTMERADGKMYQKKKEQKQARSKIS